MRLHRCIFAFLILAPVFAGPALAETAPCKPSLVASVSMVVAPRATWALAPVSLNGMKTYLAIDTGGVVSTLRYDVAQRLSLPMGDAPFEMINVAGQRLYRNATVRRFELGHLTFPNTEFMLEPEFDMASGLGGPISGTLSPDFLRKYDVEFDLAHAKLNLFTPSTCANLAYWNPSAAAAVKVEVLEDGHIFFPTWVDGKRIETMLDTGMSLTTMDLSTAREKFGVDVHSGRVERMGSLTDTEAGAMYRYQFKTLAIQDGRVSEQSPRIVLMPDMHPREEGPPRRRAKLILGLSTLKTLHLYIAYKRQMLYFTPASGPPMATALPPGMLAPPDSGPNSLQGTVSPDGSTN